MKITLIIANIYLTINTVVETNVAFCTLTLLQLTIFYCSKIQNDKTNDKTQR